MPAVFVLERDWERARDYFTQPEKDVLRAAVVGEAICPRGVFVDEGKAGAVGQKLKNLLAQHGTTEPVR